MRLALFLASLLALAGCGPVDEPPGEHRVCCPDGETVPEGCPDDSCDEDGGWWPDLVGEPT